MKIIDAKKLSDTRIEVTSQAEPPDPIVQEYDVDELVERLKIIQDTWDAQIESINNSHQPQVDEINAILDQCNTLGIESKENPVMRVIISH